MEKDYYYDEEIDLYELWLVLKKHKKLIILITIILTLTASIYAFLYPPVFERTITVTLPADGNRALISLKATEGIISPIKTAIEEKDYKQIRNIFQTVNNIKTIKAVEMEHDRNEKETFKINILSTDRRNLPKISQDIINYLNNNPYVKNKILAAIKTTEEEINILNKTLPQLEQEAKSIKEKIKNNRQLTLMFNPLDIDTSITRTKQRIITLRTKLQSEIHGYEIISSTQPDNPVKPKKVLIICVSAISGLFLGIFAAFFKEWLENARKEHQSVDKEK